MTCKSVRRRLREKLVLPLEEYGEFAGSADEVAEKLKTEDDNVASTLLDEAERAFAEPFERAEGAERRATTLQGAVAIAASFGLASAALLLDTNKIQSNGWRQAFAVFSFAFVFCLVASGFRAVAAVYRVHQWSYPAAEEIFERAKLSSAAAKTLRAAGLLRTLSRNQAIARWKVAYMRAAAWWFRWALLFLLADAVLLVLYAFFGSRFPHLSVPWTRSSSTDHFYDRYLPLALIPLLGLWLLLTWRRGRGSLDRQYGMLAVLAVGLVAAVCLERFFPSLRVHAVSLRNAGVGVGLLAAAWLAWTHRVLGASYSGGLTPTHDHKIVTDGPYALVRHPCYLGMIALSIAALLIWSWGFACATVALAIVAYWAGRREEEGLLDHDRERYEAYRSCVRDRVIPGDRLLPL